MRHVRFALFAHSLAVAGLPDPARAATIHVPGDDSTIQAAIDASSVGDEILVGPGTYSDADVSTVTLGSGAPVEIASCAFLRPGGALRSEQGPGVREISSRSLDHHRIGNLGRLVENLGFFP